MSESSNASMKFGFGDQDAKPNEQPKTETPKENSSQVVEESDKELDEEYTDKRNITISLVTNYSLYRRRNDKVMPKRKDYIGSCVNSSRILSSNRKEIETYFPNILGIDGNNESFITRVKQYLNNIRIGVDELGKKFDISFIYNHKRDYLAIAKEEERIEAEYNKCNRSNITLLKEALNKKIYDINLLESKKYALGRPVNVEDYLMYRHCLLYSDVAKDIAVINSNPNIRFYFKDDRKEAEKLRKYRLEVNKAKSNYVSCLADDDLFNAVFIKYCVDSNLPIMSSLAESKLDKEIKLDKFSSDEPVKFNRIFNDKDIKLVGNIELLIARGELIRYPNNQNITTPDGTFVGANMSEAITWFKNPDNSQTVNAYLNKLKNI